MQVSNNLSAFNVWRNYTNNANSLRESMAKLSSGRRINNAGDDPSGLAMSERLRAQARNSAAAASNVENKLNYLQTSDSWMQKIHDLLGRMGELAVESNDGTLSVTDRAVLQEEFGQMQAEIVRITDSAGKFNGLDLFKGSAIIQQVGPDSGQTFTGSSVDIESTTATDLDGVGAGTTTWADLVDGTIDIATQTDAGNAISDIQLGVDLISNARADVGAEINRMEQTLDGLRSYEENILAADNRIRDVDIAAETIALSRFSILQSINIAMLAQANQISQSVLQLFK